MSKKKKTKHEKFMEKLVKDGRPGWVRKSILDLAYHLGVIRIVSKRKPLPKWNEFPADPCTTYQAYELVDDRVS